MHILFLSRWFPFPPNNGSKLRIHNLLTGLATEHKVTLISFYEPAEVSPDLKVKNSPCLRTILVPWRPFNSGSSRSRLGFFSNTPRSLIDTFSPEMAASIQSGLLEEEIQLVIASQIDMAYYRQYFRDLPAVFEEAEVGTLYDQWKIAQTSKDRLRYGLTWMKYRAFLSKLLAEYQVCTVASSQECQLIHETVRRDARIEIIPNAVDLTKYRTVNRDRKPDTIIFTGSFSYNPNYQAMIWFSREVYGTIRKEIPDVNLTITGDNLGLELPMRKELSLQGWSIRCIP